MKKNALDLRLIKGEMTAQDYANEVNSQIDIMVEAYAKYNLIETHEKHHRLIDLKLIPDYSQLRKLLFG